MEISNIRCPNCGGSVRFSGTEDTVYCDYCGSLLGIERDVENPKPILIHSTDKRSGVRTATPKGDRNTPPAPRALYYMISFIVPIIGLIWGLQYWRADNQSARTFARVCLGIAIFNFVIEVLFYGILIIVAIVLEISMGAG